MYNSFSLGHFLGVVVLRRLVPIARTKSDSLIHLWAGQVVAPLPAPKASRCLSSMADLPSMVAKTGISINSANSFNSLQPPEDKTPDQAHIIGFLALRISLTASFMLFNEGTVEEATGEW